MTDLLSFAATAGFSRAEQETLVTALEQERSRFGLSVRTLEELWAVYHGACYDDPTQFLEALGLDRFPRKDALVAWMQEVGQRLRSTDVRQHARAAGFSRDEQEVLVAAWMNIHALSGFEVHTVEDLWAWYKGARCGNEADFLSESSLDHFSRKDAVLAWLREGDRRWGGNK